MICVCREEFAEEGFPQKTQIIAEEEYAEDCAEEGFPQISQIIAEEGRRGRLPAEGADCRREEYAEEYAEEGFIILRKSAPFAGKSSLRTRRLLCELAFA